MPLIQYMHILEASEFLINGIWIFFTFQVVKKEEENFLSHSKEYDGVGVTVDNFQIQTQKFSPFFYHFTTQKKGICYI